MQTVMQLCTCLQNLPKIAERYVRIPDAKQDPQKPPRSHDPDLFSESIITSKMMLKKTYTYNIRNRIWHAL